MASQAPNTPEKPDWARTAGERRRRARAEGGQPPRRRRRWLIAVLVLALAAGGYALWQRGPGAADGEQGENLQAAGGQAAGGQAPGDPQDAGLVMQLTPEEVLTVTPGLLRETVKVTGALAPQRQVHIASEVSGRLEDVLVREGDSVEEGALLAQVDIETLRNALEQQRATAEATRAQLNLAQVQLERTQNLVDRGLSASSELETGLAQVDQLSASLAAQERQVASAETALSKARILAPFAGMISERSVDPGGYVGTGTSLMTMVDLTGMEFEAFVPVRYAPVLAPGLAVEIAVEGVAGDRFTGTVDRLNPVAVAGTRMLPVYVALGNPEGQLRGGMFASGRLVLEEKAGGIAVPHDAVLEDDAGSYVLRLEDETLQRRPIEVARAWEGGRLLEVSAGLAEGDRIVALPLEQLRPGTRIEMAGN